MFISPVVLDDLLQLHLQLLPADVLQALVPVALRLSEVPGRRGEVLRSVKWIIFIAITRLPTLLILSSLLRGEREDKSNHYPERWGCIYSLDLPAVRGGPQQREGGGVRVVQRALGPTLPERYNDNTADIIPSLSPLTADNIQNLSPFIAFILFKSPVQPGSRLGVLDGGLSAGVRVWQSVACNR